MCELALVAACAASSLSSTGHSPPFPSRGASPAAGMGRKNKGRSVHTPNWEERDDISPFKLAEKRLKRYKGRATDLSGVLDFAVAPPPCSTDSARPDPAATEKCGTVILGPDFRPSLMQDSCGRAEAIGVRRVQVPGHDGLIILPGFLSEEAQLQLAERCLAGMCCVLRMLPVCSAHAN